MAGGFIPGHRLIFDADALDPAHGAAGIGVDQAPPSRSPPSTASSVLGTTHLDELNRRCLAPGSTVTSASWLTVGMLRMAYQSPRGLPPDDSPPGDWSGSWNGKLHGTITAEADGWLAYVRLEEPHWPFAPITTVGRYDTVDEAHVATDEEWAAR